MLFVGVNLGWQKRMDIQSSCWQILKFMFLLYSSDQIIHIFLIYKYLIVIGHSSCNNISIYNNSELSVVCLVSCLTFLTTLTGMPVEHIAKNPWRRGSLNSPIYLGKWERKIIIHINLTLVLRLLLVFYDNDVVSTILSSMRTIATYFNAKLTLCLFILYIHKS